MQQLYSKNARCVEMKQLSLFIYFKQFTLAMVILGNFERQLPISAKPISVIQWSMVVTFIFTKISISNKLTPYIINTYIHSPTPCNQVQVNGTNCYVTYPTTDQSASQYQILSYGFNQLQLKTLRFLLAAKLKTLRIYQL